MSNTILCLNQDCLTVNSINHKFCEKCGEKVLLRERYQAVKLIGQGGFGRTFLARDLDKPSKPYCVIKQFFPSAQGMNNIEKASELFAQEAERLEHLGKHSQIPELFAYFVTDDGRQYLVQEYIAGENLQTELENHGMYQEAEVKELLIEILNILKFVHENQVIHRDIKPENIIRRTSDQKLVLVDFGAAKYITSQSALNVTGTVIGSAQYCSPEQARGKPIFASDLYSLGVTCIHLLTQVDAFQLFDISENDWVWRDYLVNNPVSDQFGQVLDQLIAMGLKKRFGTVQAVFQALNYQVLPQVPLSKEKVEKNSLSNASQVKPKYPLPPKMPPLPSKLKTANVNPSQTNPKTERKIETVEFMTPTVTVVQKKNFLGLSNTYKIDNKTTSCQIVTFDLGNDIKIEMVYIPGGTFDMGSNENQNEKPIHKVNIKPFYLGKYPITQAQYQAIMGDNPSLFESLNRPVEQVSWNMAKMFCQKQSQKVGHKFSLPSESQWEYATRARTTTPFYFGETLTDQLANYNAEYTYADGPKGVYRKQTTNVGSFPPNAFGLYDMHGNVWEWCEDSWHDNYVGHPNNGSAWVLPDNQKKLLRGGAWNVIPNNCRVANRNYDNSVYICNNIGFRVICEIL